MVTRSLSRRHWLGLRRACRLPMLTIQEIERASESCLSNAVRHHICTEYLPRLEVEYAQRRVAPGTDEDQPARRRQRATEIERAQSRASDSVESSGG
jgi:hypothetical protein